MKKTQRMIICTRDIQLITGKYERTARRIIEKIRQNNNKPGNAFVTFDEFCTYCRRKKEDVLTVIN
ncbi:MAG: hypothetical protein H7258_02980 [Ferruginibacter sp.]|nr:hypothetical protein [Ferruginibacter sp.]